MLQWFHQEFFDPTDSPLPAMGFPKGNNGVDNFPVGPVQAKLVEYFSQPKDDLKLLHITAPWLLNEFHKKHNTDGLSEQDVIQPQAIMQSQVDLYAQSLPGLISSTALVAGLQNPYRQDVFTTHMLETLADSLGHQIDSLSATCGKVKYIHPELRIGIVESDALRVVHFSHQIRILKAGAPVTLASDELLRRIKRVLSFVDRFHFDSLPIHGLVPITSDRSWDQWFTQDSSSQLFGPVQRELIRMLSHSLDATGAVKPEWETERALLVVIWYSHHFPDEMKLLSNRHSTTPTKRRKTTSNSFPIQ
ncbi:hypothetical protein PCASD_24941 [Puccinia coronata f. sp. avenae]|nr:hypothetical protein PCASD_24941 [Puccinia coronata f. sp. avenae]